MSKPDLSEADICDRYITPSLHRAGWQPRWRRYKQWQQLEDTPAEDLLKSSYFVELGGKAPRYYQ